MMDRKGVSKTKKKINDPRPIGNSQTMMIIFTLIGLAATFSSVFEIKLSGHKRGATDAFFSADSGVQESVANIENFNSPGKYIHKK